MLNKHTRSSFDDFLKEEDILEAVETIAIERVINYSLEKVIKRKHFKESDMTVQY